MLGRVREPSVKFVPVLIAGPAPAREREMRKKGLSFPALLELLNPASRDKFDEYFIRVHIFVVRARESARTGEVLILAPTRNLSQILEFPSGRHSLQANSIVSTMMAGSLNTLCFFAVLRFPLRRFDPFPCRHSTLLLDVVTTDVPKLLSGLLHVCLCLRSWPSCLNNTSMHSSRVLSPRELKPLWPLLVLGSHLAA